MGHAQCQSAPKVGPARFAAVLEGVVGVSSPMTVVMYATAESGFVIVALHLAA